MFVYIIFVSNNEKTHRYNCNCNFTIRTHKNEVVGILPDISHFKVPSLKEVDNQGYDEIYEGNPIIDYYKKLAKKPRIFAFDYTHNSRVEVWNAYSYKDHYYAVLANLRKPGSKVYCRYIGKDGKEIGKPLKSIVYPLFVVYCSRRNNTVSLSITVHKKDKTNTENSKKLTGRKFQEYQHNVSFCLAPVYGKEPKWLNAVELIEHYKLQGITHFFIYIRDIEEYDMEVFKSYEKSGEVEIIQIPLTNDDVIAQQLMGVADCLLRSRTYSKWSIYADIDERLIMTDENKTIDQFIRSITDESIASLTFPQRWIFKREEHPPVFINDAQIVEKMPTRAWHETTSPAMKGHPLCEKKQPNCWGKHIVKNEKAISLLVHDVEVFYSGYRQLFLDSADGYIRHYRDSNMQSWENKNLDNLLQFGPLYNTSYPTKMGNQLLKNVLARLHTVYT